MNIENRYFLEVWIGLAKVKSIKQDVLGTSNGAYVNVLGLANNKVNFRRKVKLALTNLGLELMRLEEMEPFNERITHHKVDISLRKMAKDILINNTHVEFGTFHTYD